MTILQMRDQDSFQCFFKLIQLIDSEAGNSNIYMTLHLVCFPLNFAVYQTILLCDLAADAAKSLQSCPNLCDPIDGSPPGSPSSLGFSRKEHWSRLPFPSPMHESEK